MNIIIPQSFGVRMLQSLTFLHNDARMAHRDLKGENVLVNTATGDVSLIDIGLAEIYGREYGDMDCFDSTANLKLRPMCFSKDLAGTPLFLAPELHDPESVTSVEGNIMVSKYCI